MLLVRTLYNTEGISLMPSIGWLKYISQVGTYKLACFYCHVVGTISVIEI